MSHIPIDKQLRAHGLRRAKTGEDALVVCLSHKGESLAISAVQMPIALDEMVVVVLRAFAGTLWARCPELTLNQLRMAMCVYSEQIGATDAEVTQASLRLELVRE